MEHVFVQDSMGCTFGHTFTQENVDAVIIEDTHVTYREIEAKLVSRWIPHLLTEEQKAARVNWCQKTLDRKLKTYSAVRVSQGEEKPTKVIRSRIITELRKINPERRIILYQDNASSHTAQKTIYPDLSPSDLFTFPKIKNRLRGQRLQSPEEVVDAFKNANKCFENWFERMPITRRYDRSFVPMEAFPSSTNLRQFKNRNKKMSLGSS
ncbi:unnamed protein product [Acanthoscelides obtectus]|uniref:Transposase n=1 Tax=Acanthoscelides obtectus TaxID=200917 RepID=A0A9P0KZM9_ACAOB|nr:unnamed protein product [Acanthoscelides obtectus]CAK1652282.1 hypothetical protein AOBTE_LOCUS17765 [Acanthoscelides obtectus]